MIGDPITLSLKLAAITTLILLLLSIPLAYWLAYSKQKVKVIVETLVSMPLVLPPTVIGFYLLIVFSPLYPPGSWLNDYLGIKLIFSFEGLVFASVIYSLPFMVQPIQSGFTNLPSYLKEAAYTLGKSPFNTLLNVLLPNIKASLLSAIVLTFAHTLGEFGVVLMIGGNIPGETRVASIAIYHEVEGLNYDLAHKYSLILFIIAFAIVMAVYLLNGSSLLKQRR